MTLPRGLGRVLPWLLLPLAVGVGCGAPAGTRPADFALELHWAAGTVPPPYHYVYVIRVGPAEQVQISYWPDYSVHKPPVWSEEADLTAGDLDHLYEALRDAKVFGRPWRELADWPIGGDTTWLRVTAGGRDYHVPAHPADPRQAGQIVGIYRLIRQLVPREAWTRLNAQRAEFEAQYGAE